MRRSLGASFLATMKWRLRGFGKDLVHGLRALDPDLSAYAVQTLEKRCDTVVFTHRFASVAMAVLALMSLLLAAMGLYGADSRKLVGHGLGEALNLVGVGVALGPPALSPSPGSCRQCCFRSAPQDPASMAATVVVIAMVAALIPARRASRIDPVDSLR